MANGHTKGPWIWTTFTKPDGSPIQSAQDVAETTSFSALKSDRAELHGVTLSGDDDGVVVCYTGNGPNAHNNARLIAAAPDMYEALDECPLPSTLRGTQDFYQRFYDWYDGMRKAALTKAHSAE